jgi:hypothetical protein
MTDCTRVGDVRLLWEVDRWDRPLCGLAHHNGRDYWFEIEGFDPDDPPAEFRYFLYPLTDEELEDEREEHRKFQKYVGTHCDYDANGVDQSGEVNWAEPEKFYVDRPILVRIYLSRPPIAWFTWRAAFGGTYFDVEAPLAAELERLADAHARGTLDDSTFADWKCMLLHIRDWNERANAGDQHLDGDSR